MVAPMKSGPPTHPLRTGVTGKTFCSLPGSPNPNWIWKPVTPVELDEPTWS